MSTEGSVGTMMCQALHQPHTQHVQNYVLLLLSLRDTLDKVSTESNQSKDECVEESRNRAQAAGKGASSAVGRAPKRT